MTQRQLQIKNYKLQINDAKAITN